MSLEVHDHAGARLIEIARADKGNALGAGLVESLIDAVDRAYGDDAIDTLVLCARGRNFCTGLDLSDLDSVSDGDLLLRLVRIETLLARIWHAPIRTVAIAQGRCWGAGADLFAACEQRFATADATFRFPGVQFGILLGTRRLADRIGVEPARAILTEGRQLDAIAGRDLRLVDSIAAAPADDTGSVDPGAFEPVSFATRWLDRRTGDHGRPRTGPRASRSDPTRSSRRRPRETREQRVAARTQAAHRRVSRTDRQTPRPLASRHPRRIIRRQAPDRRSAEHDRLRQFAWEALRPHPYSV